MPIHCAAALESSEATRATIGGKNCRGGAWLPREISISLVEREDGESNMARMNRAMAGLPSTTLVCDLSPREIVNFTWIL